MTDRAKYSADVENLTTHALKPLMRWLIAVALDESTMTYGEAKDRLEAEEGFSTIFSPMMGKPAGALIWRIQQVEPKAPLINVLLVAQKDRLPGEGTGYFFAKRFRRPELEAPDFKKNHPDEWERVFEKAANEVYQYSLEGWLDLYERVFETSLSPGEIEKERKKRHKGTEKDGIRYGRSGEGDRHKALRLWVKANPQAVRAAYSDARTETEVQLDSGDRVDAVYYTRHGTVVLEVKSRESNHIDLRRGVYQCIKYRAVQNAMNVRKDAPVEAYLVTEESLPGEISDLLKLHKIKHFQAPKKRSA